MERDLSLDRCQGDCVIYARYSSHNQRDVSIEQQVADCEAYARSLGLRVVKVYADRALSGMTDKRPQFQTMLRDAAHRRWAYLIVWKIDRFARNRYDSATYKFRLKRCGVRVLYAKESIPDGPEGILLESVLEGSAEYYSANLSQNIRRGMRYNAMNCKVNSGSIPFGYRKGEDGRFAVDPGEAEVVREIFRKVADGIPFVEISNDLNGRGIRTKRGGLWGRNSFHRLLTNETYVGVYRFGDVRVEDGVPPVIDRALFLAVDERLKNKKNPQGRHRENGEYMLTGKLFCGLCGAPMVGVSGTARSGALHHYYVCQKRRTERSCSKANVGRDWLERVVVQATLDYVLKPEVIEWMADAVMAYQEREANSAVLLGLRDQLSENQRATANLMKAIEAGIITLTTKGRLVELEAEASRLRDAITLEEAAQTHIERDFMVYWFEKFRGGDLEDAAFRRRVIDSFVNAVYLWDDRLRVAFNYSGKGSAVDMELVMDAEALAGPEGRFVLAPPASTISLAVILVKLRRAFCVDTLMFELDREVYCMKKVLSVSIKTIIFFVGWAICVSVIPIPDTASAVIWRFWAELIPLLSVIAITLIFWLADQKKIRLHLTGKPVYNIILGGVTGTIWLGASVGILSILGVVQIEGKNQIAMLWLWLLAAFLNTVMQEMLVRGYLYQMIKSNGSIAAAIIVSTGLFTFAHGGAFEAGILPVLNVITMSLFMTAVLEYTGSLIAPIVIHFLWNGVGAIILGGASLAEDYPHLFDMTIHGNPILSGGSCKIEGSIIVLFMNLAFLIGFVAAKKRKDRNR